MKGRRQRIDRRLSRRLAVPPEAMARVAAAINEEHALYLDRGYRLTAASTLHAHRDGTVTVRLVYRHRGGGRSITWTATPTRLVPG